MNVHLPCPARSDLELAPFTTFRMGGRAPLVAEPRNREEFVAAVAALRAQGLSFRVLGGGANLFIDDRGIDEVVVLSAGMSFMLREAEDTRLLRLGAGLSLPRFVASARAMGRSGAEFLAGIPGSVGGATVMNAGGRHGELSGIARRVRVLLPSGAEEEVAAGAGTFGYRASIFGPEMIVLETVVELEQGDRKQSGELMRACLKEKGAAQPLTRRSAGCVFKNPPGQSAGRMLDLAGCKGQKCGGAEVSEKHANFIVNAGGATLQDVLALVRRMREAVLERYATALELEVEIWQRGFAAGSSDPEGRGGR
ncbi:MAG: UDP-N-acetylmuramate dehydrogenase [Planctomycetes bacterium]|nr:UDP-N-acetylmuramate dehydrogenase [Planctomycetota bacterium]